MEMQETINEAGLPETLLAALDAYEADPSFFPPQGSPSLRAMNRMGGEPTKADFEWIEKQEALHVRAAEVEDRLYRIAPMPTHDDIVEGRPVVYPAWAGAAWHETLIQPWSQNLEEAIEEAEAFVAELETESSEA